MLSNKIESVRAALGALAGQVSPEHRQILKSCRLALEGLRESALELENRLVPQDIEQDQRATRRAQ